MIDSKISIPRANTPEEVGVSSKVAADFIRNFSEKGLEFHSLMVIRHGKVCVEFYREPFSANRPHMMYSISKSITSTAIGFAVDEGLISLDDRVRDFFPEYTDKINDEKLDKLLIRHLLSMTSGKEISFLSDKGKIDWIEDYFTSKWYAEPGAVFKYINENIYMLCAILVRITGICVRDFLKPRLFEPLGIDYPFWETDKNGIEAGGWGLYLKTEDLAKIMLCYQQHGKFLGKQVIPEEWTEIATKAQSENSVQQLGGGENDGYGFCFWRNGDGRGSYRADGMFSQFGMVFEEHDAVVVVTSSIPDEEIARQYVAQYFPKAFDDFDSKQDISESVNIKDIADAYPLKQPEETYRSTREVMINGRTMRFRKNILLNLVGFPMSVLPLAVVYMTTDKAGNIDNVVLNFGDKEVVMDWTEGDEFNSAVCGMDGRYRYGDIRLGGINYKICANAMWQDDDNLIINIRPLETVGKRILRFNFVNNNRVNVYPSSTPPISEIAETLVQFVCDFIGLKKKSKVIEAIMTKILPKILEPKMRGKILK